MEVICSVNYTRASPSFIHTPHLGSLQCVHGFSLGPPNGSERRLDKDLGSWSPSKRDLAAVCLPCCPTCFLISRKQPRGSDAYRYGTYSACTVEYTIFRRRQYLLHLKLQTSARPRGRIRKCSIRIDLFDPTDYFLPRSSPPRNCGWGRTKSTLLLLNHIPGAH